MVKRATVVILCIFIAILASAVSLRLYQRVPATVPQSTGSQPNLNYLVVGTDGSGSLQTSIPVKQALLSDLPTSIQYVAISDDTPPSQYWVPRDQRHVIAQVLAWLKTAAPDEEKMPPSPTVIMAAYLGPSQLHLTTPDRQHLSIYPAYYYTEAVNKQNGQTEEQVNYVPDMIVLCSPTGVSYFKSSQLYDWLMTDQWKTEFMPE
jgi:hypothetical protein